MTRRIVLAYSGSLGTSVAIPWLAEAHGAEVVALALDLGQGQDLEEVRDRALAAGAVRAHVLDVREAFAREYVLPALQAGALWKGRDPLAAALGRPLIARKLMDMAAIERAAAVAHGGQGAGRLGIERCARALAPDVPVIAPARDWGMTQAGLVEYARRRQVPVPALNRRGVSGNLWGRTTRGAAPAAAFAMTTAAADAPGTPAYVEVAFERGVPTAINGVPLSPTEIIESVAIIAGQHGVGRIDMAEAANGHDVGPEVHEAPAAVVLHAAHRALERAVSPPELQRLTQELSAIYAGLVRDGLWFTPTREALDAFTATVQERVTGVVRVKLSNGRHLVVDRSSPYALDAPDLDASEPALAAPAGVPGS
jgi:argininosuccinate synthase